MNIVGGYASITLNEDLLKSFSAVGLRITDLFGNDLDDGEVNLPSITGIIDPESGKGGLLFTNGIHLQAQAFKARMQNIAFDNNGSAVVFSGVLSVDGDLLGRQELFIVNAKPVFKLPLEEKSGKMALRTLSLAFAPAFGQIPNGKFGEQFTQTPRTIGTADAFPLVAPGL